MADKAEQDATEQRLQRLEDAVSIVGLIKGLEASVADKAEQDATEQRLQRLRLEDAVSVVGVIEGCHRAASAEAEAGRCSECRGCNERMPQSNARRGWKMQRVSWV